MSTVPITQLLHLLLFLPWISRILYPDNVAIGRKKVKNRYLIINFTAGIHFTAPHFPAGQASFFTRVFRSKKQPQSKHFFFFLSAQTRQNLILFSEIACSAFTAAFIAPIATALNFPQQPII
jgi:hypothetical protein